MVNLPVLGMATFSSLQKSVLRLLGRRYSVEAFEGERSDALCGRCGHRGPLNQRCPLYFLRRGASHRSPRVPRRGVLSGQGRTCAHVTVKCLNFRGPHFTRAGACPRRTEAGARPGARVGDAGVGERYRLWRISFYFILSFFCPVDWGKGIGEPHNGGREERRSGRDLDL